MTLGEKIYTLRTEKGMSQTDLAEALDVSRQSISKWETDASTPELDKLVKLSEIFGVSLDELVLGKEENRMQPELQAKPQLQSPSPVRRTTGTVLLCFGAMVWLLITLLGDFFSGLVFCAPFVLCGLVLLFKRRFPGLWCGWAVYLCVDVYLQYATGINHSYAFVPQVYAYTAPIHWIVAWALVAAFGSLSVATVLCYRKDPMKNSGRNLFYTIGLWVLFLLSYFLIYLFGRVPIIPEVMAFYRIAVAFISWIRKALLVVCLVYTLRFTHNSKHA